MRIKAIAAALSLSALACAPALAEPAEPTGGGQRVYVYAVMHPVYGEIGTYTDTIDRGPGTIRIDGCLRISVKVLGLVAYRMESDTTEILRGDRLISLRSATDKDGERLEVRGEARGDQFFVNGTGGSFAGPANIAPTDPWLLTRTGEETVVFTDTGRIFNVSISGGDMDTVKVNGVPVAARHFVVTGVRRQEVWFDDGKIPVMFRVVEDGTPIDFVLKNGVASANGSPSSVPVSQRAMLVLTEANTR
jgi:hypothetical protein